MYTAICLLLTVLVGMMVYVGLVALGVDKEVAGMLLIPIGVFGGTAAASTDF